MNRKEINEIKKNFKQESGFFTLNKILLTIVNANHEVEMQSVSSPLLLSERAERVYRDILLQTLNTNVGRKSIQIDFEAQSDGDSNMSVTQSVLYGIVSTSLNSKQAIEDYTDKIVLTYTAPGPYAVITAHCTYTVRRKNKNDETDEMECEDYNFIASAYCPVCAVDSGFSYDFSTKTFSTEEDKKLYVVPKARHGLLFPTFDNRSANIHSAMIYSAKEKEYPLFYIENGLGCAAPLSAEAERKTWLSILESTFGDELDYPFLYELNRRLLDSAEEFKHETRLTSWGGRRFTSELNALGVDKDKLDKFLTVWNYTMDKGLFPGYLHVENIIDKKYTVKTSEFTISYTAEHGDSVSPTIIEGSRSFALKTADAVVAVNGAAINL